MVPEALITRIVEILHAISMNQLITVGILAIPLIQISWYLRSIAKSLEEKKDPDHPLA